MIKKIHVTAALALLLIFQSQGLALTTAKENDLLIRQAWRAGQQMIENGLYKRGAEYLEAYVKNRPQSPDGWYWLAKAYQGQGMLSKAQAAFTKVLEVDPEYPPLSRVFQNRAIGDSIPLMDPSGSDYMQGLPVVDSENGIFPDQVLGRPAPLQTGQTQTPGPNGSGQGKKQPKPFATNQGFSPMGARKTVIAPQREASSEEGEAQPEISAMPIIMVPEDMFVVAVKASMDLPDKLPSEPRSEDLSAEKDTEAKTKE